MSEIEKVATNDTSDLEKISDDGAKDFEGHRVAAAAIEPKVEPDFEGHRMELKVEPKVSDRVSD